MDSPLQTTRSQSPRLPASSVTPWLWVLSMDAPRQQLCTLKTLQLTTGGPAGKVKCANGHTGRPKPKTCSLCGSSDHGLSPKHCRGLLSIQPKRSIFKICLSRAWHDSTVVKVLALHVPGFHMSAGSNPGGPASHPAPCLWPGKAVEDGPKPWDPAPSSGRPGGSSWLLALDWLSSSCCGHLG